MAVNLEHTITSRHVTVWGEREQIGGESRTPSRVPHACSTTTYSTLKYPASSPKQTSNERGRLIAGESVLRDGTELEDTFADSKSSVNCITLLVDRKAG